MERVIDTALTHGALCYPIEHPRTSLLVVVKATYAITSGEAPLADTQDPVTGALHWDDDPERSVRYPTDLALLKPRGECFVIGHCRPLTGRAEPRSVVAFEIGTVQKTLVVHGDRRWQGRAPGPPIPFTEMPLCWERAYGGASVAANPMGRPLDGELLPNIEPDGAAITSPADRATPAGAFPLAMTWRSRAQYTGTYDARWKAERYPYLPADFRFAFYNEAPLDQRIDGYWAGGERIALKHLHPSQPNARCTLPMRRPRAFVERERTAVDEPPPFEEVGLVCDTIVVDADRGVVNVVWRGALPLDTRALEPEGIARLFVMDETLATGARAADVASCRQRMYDKLARDAAELEGQAGEAPPAVEDEAMHTLVDGAEAAVAAAQAAHEQKKALERQPDPAVGEAQLAKLDAALAAAGIDVAAAEAAAETPAEPPEPLSYERMKEVFESVGGQVPDELEAWMEEAAEGGHAPEVYEPPEPPPPVDLRERVIDLHRRGLPLGSGDYTGANLSGLKLPGLDARGAILVDAGLRGADLTDARFEDAALIRADFLGATLDKAKLTGADLSQAVLEAATLRGARLDAALLEGAEMQEAVFDEASLVGAQLFGADLEGASFVSANLTQAIFDGAKLAGARFVSATLHETRFYGAAAHSLVLDHADCAKARFGRGSDLSGSSARGIKGAHSNWRYAILTGCDFSGAGLDGADFTGAVLENAQLGSCHLRRAVFQEATLTGASLRASDVYEGSFRGASLERADLRSANLYSCNFFEAHGTGLALDGANLDGTAWERK